MSNLSENAKLALEDIKWVQGVFDKESKAHPDEPRWNLESFWYGDAVRYNLGRAKEHKEFVLDEYYNDAGQRIPDLDNDDFLAAIDELEKAGIIELVFYGVPEGFSAYGNHPSWLQVDACLIL